MSKKHIIKLHVEYTESSNSAESSDNVDFKMDVVSKKLEAELAKLSDKDISLKGLNVELHFEVNDDELQTDTFDDLEDKIKNLRIKRESKSLEVTDVKVNSMINTLL